LGEEPAALDQLALTNRLAGADLEGLVDAGDERPRVDRLDHVVVDLADGAGALDVGDVGVAGQEDAGHGRVARAQRVSEAVSRGILWSVIQRRLALQESQRSPLAQRDREPVSGSPLEEVEDVGLVVDCQEAQAGGRHGVMVAQAHPGVTRECTSGRFRRPPVLG
jgi:hypothetical protein